jgi:hypothetical protein
LLLGARRCRFNIGFFRSISNNCGLLWTIAEHISSSFVVLALGSSGGRLAPAGSKRKPRRSWRSGRARWPTLTQAPAGLLRGSMDDGLRPIHHHTDAKVRAPAILYGLTLVLQRVLETTRGCSRPCPPQRLQRATCTAA